MSKEKWLAVSVVAMRLNVSIMTVRRLVEKGLLKGRRVGVKGCVQVNDASVDAFIRDRVDDESP